jgi:N-acetylmuramoyl-L-alanine amidase
MPFDVFKRHADLQKSISQESLARQREANPDSPLKRPGPLAQGEPGKKSGGEIIKKGLPVLEQQSKGKIIVLDPGHGDGKWADPGALGVDDKPPHEKEYALQLAKAIGADLEKAGHTVIYTRAGDVKTTSEEKLKWRTKISNDKNADYFISVHLNSMDAKTNYFMVAYLGEEGKKLAESIASSVDQKGFSKSVVEKHSYEVLRESEACAILIEAGNVKNADNSNIITSKSFIEQVVQGIQTGIAEVEKTRKKPAGKAGVAAKKK